MLHLRIYTYRGRYLYLNIIVQYYVFNSYYLINIIIIVMYIMCCKQCTHNTINNRPVTDLSSCFTIIFEKLLANSENWKKSKCLSLPECSFTMMALLSGFIVEKLDFESWIGKTGHHFHIFGLFYLERNGSRVRIISVANFIQNKTNLIAKIIMIWLRKNHEPFVFWLNSVIWWPHAFNSHSFTRSHFLWETWNFKS